MAATSINRARLLLLVVCALLTTTFGSRNPEAPESDPQTASPPAVSSPGAPSEGLNPTTADIVVADEQATSTALSDSDSKEAAIISQILERLSMRHTALPERERVSLVHAILAEARAHNLDPGLVMAVIEVESAGYHLAVSHVGAMGLMQLLPSTGKELALRAGIEWTGDDTLFDPIINVRLGTAYLSQLTERYGSVSTALAAYNWGPGRIDRRLRRGADVPSRYITKVMRVLDRNAIVLVSRS